MHSTFDTMALYKSVFYYHVIIIRAQRIVGTEPVKKGKGTVKPLMEVFHGTATECHLPYGITQLSATRHK